MAQQTKKAWPWGWPIHRWVAGCSWTQSSSWNDRSHSMQSSIWARPTLVLLIENIKKWQFNWALGSDESSRNQHRTVPDHDRQAITSFCIVNITWIIWILFNYPRGLSRFTGVKKTKLADKPTDNSNKQITLLNLQLRSVPRTSKTKFDLYLKLQMFRNITLHLNIIHQM